MEIDYLHSKPMYKVIFSDPLVYRNSDGILCVDSINGKHKISFPKGQFKNDEPYLILDEQGTDKIFHEFDLKKIEYLGECLNFIEADEDNVANG